MLSCAGVVLLGAALCLCFLPARRTSPALPSRLAEHEPVSG